MHSCSYFNLSEYIYIYILVVVLYLDSKFVYVWGSLAGIVQWGELEDSLVIWQALGRVGRKLAELAVGGASV